MNIWTLPGSLFCPLQRLSSLNLSNNYLQVMGGRQKQVLNKNNMTLSPLSNSYFFVAKIPPSLLNPQYFFMVREDSLIPPYTCVTSYVLLYFMYVHTQLASMQIINEITHVFCVLVDYELNPLILCWHHTCAGLRNNFMKQTLSWWVWSWHQLSSTLQIISNINLVQIFTQIETIIRLILQGTHNIHMSSTKHGRT